MGKRKMYRVISFLLAMVMFLTSWQIPVFSEEVNTDAGNVVLAETGEDGKRVVTTEEEFNDALADGTVEVIELGQNLSIAPAVDNPLVISRPLTIQGGVLEMRYLGIVLGADVTFKDIQLNFTSSESDAIVANGYTLTLENVTLRSTLGENWVISLFCGGMNGYNYANLPATGANGTIILKGNCRVGDIYAGNLTHMDAEERAFGGNAEIRIDNTADRPDSVIVNIYGCGGKESMGEGSGNKINTGAENSLVTGNIQVSLYDNFIGQVIGYGQNMHVTYNGGDYLQTPILQNISSLSVESGKLQLADGSSFCGTNANVTLAEDAQLHLNLLQDVTIGNFVGGGELVLGVEQKLAITGSAAGSTRVYIGGINYYQESEVAPKKSHTYIEAAQAQKENFVFQKDESYSGFLPLFVSNGVSGGSWITEKAYENRVIVSAIEMEDVSYNPAEAVEALSSLTMPIQVTYSETGVWGYLLETEPIFSVNGESVIYDEDAGVYRTENLAFWFSDTDDLIIADETEIAIPEPGTYQFVITVPAENTEGQTQPMTAEATLTVVGEEENKPIEPVTAVVENWVGTVFSQEELEAYDEQFKINVEDTQITVVNNVTWRDEPMKNALDDDWQNTHWGATNNNNEKTPTALEVNFGKTVEVGQIVYRVRQDGGKGFPLQFKIQIATEADGEFVDAVEGSATFTYDIIAIKFEPQTCVKLRFVWLEVSPANDPDPSAAVFYCYKDDGIKAPEVTEAKVEGWSVPAYTDEERAAYDKAYRLYPVSVSSNRNHWGDSDTSKAIDDNWDNGHWEANPIGGETGKGTYLEVDFGEIVEVGHLVYRARQDMDRGFPTKFKIQVSSYANGNYFFDVAEGSAENTREFIKITFEPVECRRIRLVWLDFADSFHFPSASAFYCYKEDNLSKDVEALFTDGAATALREGVTREEVANLKETIASYPVPGAMMRYIDVAEMLLDGKKYTDTIHEPIVLSQDGDSERERARTDLWKRLSSYDLTGYYVRPGDVLDIFVEADEESPMPRLVLAEVARRYGPPSNVQWVFGDGGKELQNGLNHIKIPETMQGCQVIYFYNPASPEEQAFAPIVRLCSNGYKYPVYFYDANDPIEVAKAKEAAFIEELTAYCAKVVNNMDEAAKGNGEPNFCEFVSDKIQICTSAKAALKNIDNPYIWKAGIYKEWAEENKDNPRHAVIERDESGEVTGIRFSGPGAIMQEYEMMYDNMTLYSGFNITDPTHEDYRNRGKFVFRPYNNGAGSAWATHGYTGYNCGEVPMEDSMDSGWFDSITSGHAVLTGGWGEYHEVGHLLDNWTIGYSEATNNLYPLNAQNIYGDVTRLETDNNWYNLFTNYINTGVLPGDNLTFYPGYMIFQLDAVDFSETSIYQEKDISNYGRASRYVRLHKDDLEHLPDRLDKLVVALSMGCGVDLSSHFEFYGRTLSAETKAMLAGLPKEERPTWLVNERTFDGGAFDEADKAKAPVITSITTDEATGAVTIIVDSTIFTEENVQCFSVYRQEKINGELIGELEWIGITADNLSTKDVNELYRFTDKNVLPGSTYVYSVGVYDCELMENENKGNAQITVGEKIEVAIEHVVINKGDVAATFVVGQEYKVKVNYFPTNASVNLNEVRWWAEGYAEDYGKDGGAEHIITISPDPDYPNDPTRKVLKGVQWGKTDLYVSIGGKWQRQQINVNEEMQVNDTDTVSYKFAFNNARDTFMKGEVYELGLYRTTCDANGEPTSEVIKVRTTPKRTSWEISDPEVLSVDGHGFITAKQAGTTTVAFKRGSEVVAQCTLTVVGGNIPLESISLRDLSEDELENGITMNVGESGKLYYTLLPENTTESTKATFVSSNSNIVRFEQDGTFTAISGGTAELSIEIGDKQSEVLQVTVNEYIPVRNVTLDTYVVNLNKAGSTQTLHATKYPANATVDVSSFVWTSSNEDVFTVENGVVTAVGTGTATLTVSLEGKIATAKVTVAGADVSITGIHFAGHAVGQNTNLTLKQGKTHQLALVIEPKEATTFGTITWNSSNESVATVEHGYITALTVGQSTITATVTQEENKYQVSCDLTVEKNDILLEGWGIEQKIVMLGGNETVQLQVYPRPLNANIDAQGNPLEELQWTSDNGEIASVDRDGMVIGKKTGTATVTASANGFSVSCRINVDDSNLVESLSMDKESLTLELGETQEAQLNCTVYPETVTAIPVWKSSHPSVVEVDQNGKLTVHNLGIATITVSLGDMSASCVVTVTGADCEVQFDSAGGTNVDAQTIKAGTRVERPADPKNADYVLYNWYLVDAQGNMSDTPYDFEEEIVTEDITLKAKWQVKSPIANYPSGSVYKNTEIILSSGAEATLYYTLDGSVPTKASASYESPFVITEQTAIKVFAVEDGYVDSEVVTFDYTIRKLVVTFDMDGAAQTVATQTLNDGERVAKPANPTREGYLFRGWYQVDEEGVMSDTEYDFTTAVTRDVALKAKWEAKIGVPQINGYTQVTSMDFDPEKEYIIVSVDSDNVVYALYGNSTGLNVNPGSLTGATGAVTAVLSNLDSNPTATYLMNGSSLDMEQLHMKIAQKDSGYSFCFADEDAKENYYLYLGGSNMFSKNEIALDVSVTDGSFAIIGNNNGRQLYLNVNGDSQSRYSGHITDFWGPGPKDAINFKIYILEKIEEEVDGYSLSLEGNIGVNFHMKLGEDVINTPGAYMRFTLDGAEIAQIPIADAKYIEESDCYAFKCMVPVKDMDTEVTAQIILSENAKGSIHTYTVQKYINYISEHEQDFQNELALVESMSNFGDYAATYFDGETSEATDAMKDVEASDLEIYQGTLPKENIYYGSSLILKSDTVLRHYFTKPVKDSEGNDSVQKGNVYYIQTKGIPAHELGKNVEMTVATSEGNVTISYSPLTYAYIALSRAGVDESLKNVVRAMYLYYQEALSYLELTSNN